MSLRSIIIMTILVVRLSKIADKKKVMKAMRHNNARLDFVRITPFTQLKPPFWSTISTIVIAPIKKNRVVEVSPKWSMMSLLTKPVTCPVHSETLPACINWTNGAGSNMYSVQQNTNINKAMAALSIFTKLSMAIDA